MAAAALSTARSVIDGQYIPRDRPLPSVFPRVATSAFVKSGRIVTA